jgi:hypothetical protein
VTQRFRDARLKLDRADEHIDAVEELVECWLGTDAYSISREVDAKSGNTTRRAKIKAPPPDRISIITGDAVQNLRSALDHAVYALAASQSGGVSRAAEHALMFPVVGNENSKGQPADGSKIFPDLADRQLIGVPSRARSFIEQEQPYHWGDGYVYHWLWNVHSLNRIDKHRRLAVATAFLDFQFVSTPSNVTPRVTFFRAEGPVENDDVLVTHSSEVGVNAHFTRGVALNEGTSSERGVQEHLRNLKQRVEWIVNMLETLS